MFGTFKKVRTIVSQRVCARKDVAVKKVNIMMWIKICISKLGTCVPFIE